MNVTVSTALTAFAALAFVPGLSSTAHADESSDLFKQRLVTDACVKRGGAEPQKRIAACSEVIAHAKHAAPEMALAFLNRAAAYKALNDTTRAAADYAEALRRFDNLVDDQQPVAQIVYQRAVAYQELGQIDRALADLNRVIVLAPDNAGAHVLRGLVNSRRGDSQSAATDYDAALALDPRNMDALVNRAALYSMAGQPARALADLDAAIAIRANDPLAYYNRGYVHFSRKDYDRAIADYSKAIEFAPAMSLAFNNRCLAAVLAGHDSTVALADCDQALALTPDSVDVRATRGLVYLRIGRPELALREYEAALKLDPKRALALYGRGLARIGMGDRTGGNADRAAATLLVADIGEQFVLYGLDK